MTIEDAAELRLRQRHVVRLEARPANLEGRGEVTIRQLVVNALRMRPDRIVVGEVRGAEALDMLQALNTGHDGSLTTVHANSPADALRRMETLALMAGVGLPHAAVRDQVASALDVVVHQARLPDGSRVVESVTEVVRVAGGAGTRELWTRGGRLRRPGPGRAGGAAGARCARRARRSPAVAVARAPSCAAAARRGWSSSAGWRSRRGCARAPRWVRAGAGLVDVLVRAGREGRDPGAVERRRLLLGGSVVAFAAGAGRGRAARRARARAPRGRWAVARVLRARPRALPRARSTRACRRLAVAIADALGGGRSLRAALGEAAARARRRGRARAAAHRAPSSRPGAATDDALEAMRRRARSPRHGHARGGLPAPAPRRRRPRAACCARAPGRWRIRRGSRTRCAPPPRRRASPALIVVLLPLGGALLAELASPGWFAGLWSSFLTAWLVGIALVLQVVAAVLMRRLGRVRW